MVNLHWPLFPSFLNAKVTLLYSCRRDFRPRRNLVKDQTTSWSASFRFTQTCSSDVIQLRVNKCISIAELQGDIKTRSCYFHLLLLVVEGRKILFLVVPLYRGLDLVDYIVILIFSVYKFTIWRRERWQFSQVCCCAIHYCIGSRYAEFLEHMQSLYFFKSC